MPLERFLIYYFFLPRRSPPSNGRRTAGRSSGSCAARDEKHCFTCFNQRDGGSQHSEMEVNKNGSGQRRLKSSEGEKTLWSRKPRQLRHADSQDVIKRGCDFQVFGRTLGCPQQQHLSGSCYILEFSRCDRDTFTDKRFRMYD